MKTIECFCLGPISLIAFPGPCKFDVLKTTYNICFLKNIKFPRTNYQPTGTQQKHPIVIYYINFSELQGFLLLWKHDIFTCEDKFVIFTCEDNNDVVCAITFTKFNCRTNLNSFLCDRNIFDDSSETFGNLRQSPEIFGHLRKFSENDRKCLYELRILCGEFWKIFRNLRKMFGNLRKIAKISLMLLFI